MEAVRYTETSEGFIMMPRKGEPWREYNYAYGTGVMRGLGWTKGFCTECGKWKLFHIDYVDTHVERVWIIARADPFVFHAGAEYYGTCTNGHSGLFAPWVRPEQERWKRDATRNFVDAVLGDDRDATGKKLYQMWLEGFRKPEREAHYKPDHKCDSRCPEYEWGDDYDW